ALEKVGFQVILVTDATQKQMQRAIVDFGDRLAKAGPDAVGLFYYAGHGLQLEGQNYLVPTDADISREVDVEIDGVSADLVLKQMAYADSRVNIVILDSCRNNPLARDYRGLASNQGFAEIRSKPKGTFISYSTAPGEVAVDGNDGHSPFAEALAKAMQLPGLDLPEVFQHVREQVLDATDQKQTPWDSSSLVKSFYFVPPQADDPQADDLVADEDAAPKQVADAGTPNHDPRHLALMRAATAQPEAAPMQAVAAAPLPTTATPEMKPALKPVAKAAAAPTFVAAHDTLYAKSNARLRAAPSTTADVAAKLLANVPLRALARSTDGAWWQVALADGRTGYVHRDAVAVYRVANKLPTTTMPVAAAAPKPAPVQSRGQSPLGFVSEAMNWLANAAGTAGTGAPPPKVTRAQR
ncbi:MAG: caspase family protein, partial [Dongia sp.]